MRLLHVTLAAAAVAVTSCGGPPTSSAPAAMPPSAAYVGGSLEPMVVDWQPEQRGDLEASMHDGLVVVEHGAKGLRLLRDCRVEGSYGFLGTTRRERVVRLRSKDEVAANLPLGGLGLAASLGGEFEKGATLDIAMIMVGRARSARSRVGREDLQGTCKGATHVVRGATLGAFAVDRGESSRARSAAEIFGVGASGGTASASSVRVMDGQLASCDAASPESTKPPAQCGAVLRIELLEIDAAPAGGTAGGGKDGEGEVRSGCVPPLVSVNGICARPSREAVAECAYGDGPACEAACAKGEAASCWKLARMTNRGEGGRERSPERAAPLARRACELNEPRGCVLLGILTYQGKGVPKDLVRAAQLHRQACEAGDADGCSNLGQMFRDGEGVPKDLRLAELALTRGCNGGKAYACNDLGFMAMGTGGVQPDFPLALRLFERACNGDVGAGCGNLGVLQEHGLATKRDMAAALASYKKACALEAADCVFLGAMIQQGRGRTAGGPEPLDLYRRACAAGAMSACAIIQTYFDRTQRIDPEIATELLRTTADLCRNGLARSCAVHGIVGAATGKVQNGAALVERACAQGDDWSCLVAKLRKAS